MATHRRNTYRSPLDMHGIQEQLRGGPIEAHEQRLLMKGIVNGLLITAAGVALGVVWYLVVRG